MGDDDEEQRRKPSARHGGCGEEWGAQGEHISFGRDGTAASGASVGTRPERTGMCRSPARQAIRHPRSEDLLFAHRHSRDA